MSDISVLTNRIIPIDVELYTNTSIPASIVGGIDSEVRLQFTLKNKDATSPYAVSTTDLSSVDRVDYIFTQPNGLIYTKLAAIDSPASSGVVYLYLDKSDLNVSGTWQVAAIVTIGDIVVSYPNVPFTVE